MPVATLDRGGRAGKACLFGRGLVGDRGGARLGVHAELGQDSLDQRQRRRVVGQSSSSGVAGAGRPSLGLGPGVGSADELPQERPLGVGVAAAVIPEADGQAPFLPRILGSTPGGEGGVAAAMAGPGLRGLGGATLQGPVPPAAPATLNENVPAAVRSWVLPRKAWLSGTPGVGHGASID